LFHTGSAHGIYPSEPYLPAGIQTFPPERTHLPFRLTLFPIAEASGRPARFRFLGFVPAGSSSCSTMGLAPPRPEAPLGFTLPGRSARALTEVSPDLLSRALPIRPDGHTSRRPRVSINPHLDSPLPLGFPNAAKRPTLVGFPHRPDPEHSGALPTGAMDSPHAASCITADRPAILR
jgi:hypothetical protein